MQRAYVGQNPVDAQLAAERLRAAGIDAVVQVDTFAAPSMPFPSVWVADEELPRALGVLQDLGAAADGADPALSADRFVRSPGGIPADREHAPAASPMTAGPTRSTPPHHHRKPRRRGAGDVLLLVFDIVLVILWLAGGSQWVLGVLVAALLLLSAMFLGWVPLPGDKRRRS